MKRALFFVTFLVTMVWGSFDVFAGQTVDPVKSEDDFKITIELKDPVEEKIDSEILFNAIIESLPNSLQHWKKRKGVVLVFPDELYLNHLTEYLEKMSIDSLNSNIEQKKNEIKKEIRSIHEQILKSNVSLDTIKAKQKLVNELKTVLNELDKLSEEYHTSWESPNQKIGSPVIFKDGSLYQGSLIDVSDVLVIIISSEIGKKEIEVNIKNKRSNISKELEIFINTLPHFLPQEGSDSDSTSIEMFNAISDLPKTRTLEIPAHYIVLNPKAIQSPSDIIIKFSKEDSTVIPVLERVHLKMELALSVSSLEENYFKIEDGSVYVEAPESDVAELQGNYQLLFQFYPLGQVVENFSPSWNFKDASFWSRLGIHLGFNISSNPLEKLYAGIGFAINENFTFNAGVMSENKIKKNQIVEIGEIQSLKDVKPFLEKKYTNPTLYLGISIPPSAMTKFLGLSSK